MKRLVLSAFLGLSMAGTAGAQTIGVAMAQFDNNFLTVLRGGVEARAAELGVRLQLEDAQNDIARQMNQIQNFIAGGVDAIILVAVDSDAITALAAQTAAAGIPLVSANREPPNVDALPPLLGFVGSREVEAGTIQAEETCRLVREAGKDAGATGVILAGDLFIQAGRVRTQTVQDYVQTPDCDFITIADTQVADWSRTKAADLVSNWLSAGILPDAIFANNDEMAIGAAQALRAAGVSADDVVVAGIDATRDALRELRAGGMDLTVFQDASGQGARAVDMAIAMARGEDPERVEYIPFQLVTPENVASFETMN